MMKQIIFTIMVGLISTSLFAQTQTRLTISDYPLEGKHTVVTKEKANSIFNEIKKSPIFEFSYTRGGCDYRAHAVYLMLKKKGIKTFKIWNFASSKVFLAGKEFNKHNLLLMVKDKINLSTTKPYYATCGINISESVFWGYHVAPVLLVANKNKIDTLVIDPALFDKPIAYKTWISAQLQQNASSYFAFTEGNYISFQTESQYTRNGVNCNDCSGNNIFTGVFWDETYSIEHKLIEQSLGKGKTFVAYFKNEIEPLEKKLQNYPVGTDDPEAIKLACDIAQKKQIISAETDENNESNIIRLPTEYQNKYGEYVKLATLTLFGQ